MNDEPNEVAGGEPATEGPGGEPSATADTPPETPADSQVTDAPSETAPEAQPAEGPVELVVPVVDAPAVESADG